MRIFLSTSFSHKIDPISREVLPVYRTFIEQLLQTLRASGYEVFCAVETEGWRMTDGPQEIGVKQDLDEISNADAVLALVHDQPSAGVQFEMGYAVARGKRVILAAAAGEPLAYFNQGIVSLGLVTALTYDNAKTLLSNLTVALNAPEDTAITD